FSRAARLPYSIFKQDPGQEERERDERRQSAFLAANSYREANEYEEAARAYEYLAKESLGTRDYFEAAAQQWLQADKADEALRVLDEGLERNPLNPALLLARAELILQHSGKEELIRAKEAVYYAREIRERIPTLFTPAQNQKIEQLVQLAQALETKTTDKQ